MSGDGVGPETIFTALSRQIASLGQDISDIRSDVSEVKSTKEIVERVEEDLQHGEHRGTEQNPELEANHVTVAILIRRNSNVCRCHGAWRYSQWLASSCCRRLENPSTGTFEILSSRVSTGQDMISAELMTRMRRASSFTAFSRQSSTATSC